MRRFDPYTRTNQLIVDAGIFVLSFAAAYVIRFEGPPDWVAAKQFLLWLPLLLLARVLVNWELGIYHHIWRYVSLWDAIALGRALSVVTAVLLALWLFYPDSAALARWVRVPLSVIALEFTLSLIGTLGARALRRILYERGRKATLAPDKGRKRVILYGAGRAGILLLKELEHHSEVEVVGFADDDPKKVGTIISGAEVLGGGKALPEIVRQSQVDEVVISIATAGRKLLAQIAAQCEEIPVAAKILPSLQEIVEGRVSISHFREVRTENFLGRDSVEVTAFDDQVREVYTGKRILVTGAGGSIGSELARQLLLLHPASVAILDKDENSIYELDHELRFRFPDARIDSQIADIRHRNRLDEVFRGYKPQVVFHAAAHKHVPLMEKHPCEAVSNNVFGTKTLLDACLENNVERFVFISTDKAVNPVSVMGATKRVGEMLVQALANGGSFPAACVRFGNVMDSRGSVIPLFRRQIAEGGPITVTHPEVVRFFMTIPEAVRLVSCAGALGQHGEIFVLDMGNPRKILELAHDMVQLSGNELGKDIEIQITGLRPGEKLVEELVGPEENARPTRFDQLWMVAPCALNADKVFENVTRLMNAAQENDRERVYQVLMGMGIGFSPAYDDNMKALPSN